MSDPRKKYRTHLTLTIVSGVVMLVSPFVGLLGTIGGMSRAFDSMSTNGISDPGRLSSRIGEVLISTAAGLGVALVSLLFFVIFLVLAIRHNRKLKETSPSLQTGPPA